MNKLKFARRAGLAALAGALALSVTACGGSGSDDAAGGDTVLSRTLKVGVFPTFNGLPGYVAQEKGFFEAEGLKVELVPVGSGAAMMPQLMGGSMDFALMDLATPLTAKSEGVDIVAVAPGAVGADPAPGEKGPVGLWVRADSKIKTVKELQDTTFAIPAIGSAVWMDVREYVDNAGGDSSKIKFVEAQDQIGALLAGDVDAATASEPRDSAMLTESKLRRLDNYTTMDGSLAYSFIASNKFVSANTPTAAAFERAILKANAFINDETDQVPTIAATYVDQPAELLKKAIYPKFGTKAVTTDEINLVINRMLKYDLIKKDKAPAPADFLRSSN